MDNEPMAPPPTYMIPGCLLVFGIAMGGYEIYSVIQKGIIEISGLFLIPSFFTLGIIGLFDPRVPSSLQPSARGYPPWTRRLANACWIIGCGIGAVLYLLFVA